MTGERGSSRPMLVLLGILVFVHRFGTVLSYTQGLGFSPTLEFLHTAAFLCGVVWWLRAEVRTSSVKQVYCLGLLVGIGWVVILPYHLFKTRGIKALIPLLALIGSYVVATLLAVVGYMWH